MQSQLIEAENAMRASDFGAALAHARAAADACARAGTLRAEGVRARLLVGELLQLQGELAPALDCLTRALADAIAIDETALIVTLRCRLAFSLSDSLGLYEQALAYACNAYRLADSIRFEEGIVQALIRITGAYARVGDADRAERIGLLALSYSRDRSDAQLIWRSMTMLAVTCNVVADEHEQPSDYAAAMLERGLVYARRAQQYALAWGRGDARAVGCLTLAAALVRVGRHRDALDALDRSCALARDYGLVVVELAALRERARCLIAGGDLDAAQRTLVQAESIPAYAQHPRNRRLITKLRAECCSRLGQDALAAEYHAAHRTLQAEHDASRRSALQRYSPELPAYEDTFEMLER
ncbi:MAG: hypothetical protein KGJ30_20795, partial [Burkholderiales bacterium]|nr:hypothetical protein [Burkholderiales bacterium]